MKIIIVGAQYIGSITGGGGVHVVELTRELGKLGHEVEVLCMGLKDSPAQEQVILEDPHNPDPDKRKAKVKIVRFFPKDAASINSPFAGTKRQEIDRLLNFKKMVLDYLLEEQRGCLVHIHGHFAVPAMAKELKEKGTYKIVSSIHTFESISERTKGSDGAGEEFVKLMEEMEREAIENSDHLIVRSEQVKQQVTKLFPGAMKKTPTTVLPSAVSSVFIHSPPQTEDKLTEIREKYNIGGDLILNINRIDPSKGIENLLLAYAELYENLRQTRPGTRLSLVVAGMLEKKNYWYLEKLKGIISGIPSEETRNSISIHQDIPEQDKLALFDLAKVFVLSSLIEPFGITVVEALAKDVPVVASGVEGPKDILGQNKVKSPFSLADGGLLVDYEDPDKRAHMLFEALKYVFENPQEMKERTERGKTKTLAQYSWEALVQRKISIYKSLCG